MAVSDGEINRVTMVGGGDVGLLTALLLRKTNSELDITVVDDFDEEVPEIGKSTFDYLLPILHDVLEIDEERFVSEVKPLWKGSVYFKDWCGSEFHVPFDDGGLPLTDAPDEQFEELYYRYENDEFQTPGTKFVEHRKSPFRPDREDRYTNVAYHLTSNRLNELLRKVCRERAVELVNDRVTEVRTNDGWIESVAGETSEYEADLYIDATGFKRLLVRSLEIEYNHFDIPLDSAIVTQVDVDLADVVPATVIETGEAGWFWQIDTFDCRDIGYVYSSDHISKDEAIAQLTEKRDEDVARTDITSHEFESGFYERSWVGNCVAVGKALGFVEPLESTALTHGGMLGKKLGELLAKGHQMNYEGVRDIYNTYTKTTWESVYDFVSVHYKYASGETELWSDMQSVDSGAELDQYEKYRRHGFALNAELDRCTETANAGFGFPYWIYFRVLNGMGVESDFYENLDLDVRSEVEETVDGARKAMEDSAQQYFGYEEFYRERHDR